MTHTYTHTHTHKAETASISVRCRKRENQSFLISYVDHDGSVNRAAVVPPLDSCRIQVIIIITNK
jgi:hypothetical protein